nr:receptor expression-enhancing protein 4 [Taeniopygia guttata]
MVSWILSRVVELLFGLLYPAYASYKAVKTKNIREYVRWMMYWIVFSLFMATETFTDLLISWLPFYYELKMAFVLWLLSPYTRGAGLLYRRFVHPALARREKELDALLLRARQRGYEAALRLGKRGLNLAATAAVQAATKSQGALAGRLRSFSLQDLRCLPEQDLPCPEEQQSHPLGYSSYSSGSEDEDEELWSHPRVSPCPPALSPCPPALRTLRKTPAKEVRGQRGTRGGDVGHLRGCPECPFSCPGLLPAPAQPRQEESGSGGAGRLKFPGILGQGGCAGAPGGSCGTLCPHGGTLCPQGGTLCPQGGSCTPKVPPPSLGWLLHL